MLFLYLAWQLPGSLSIVLYAVLYRSTPLNLDKWPTLHTDPTGQTYIDKSYKKVHGRQIPPNIAIVATEMGLSLQKWKLYDTLFQTEIILTKS